MAKINTSSNKIKQISIEEYNKIKEKLAKSKLKLTFPWIIKVVFIIPVVYCAFLIAYYLFHLRFLPEH